MPEPKEPDFWFKMFDWLVTRVDWTTTTGQIYGILIILVILTVSGLGASKFLSSLEKLLKAFQDFSWPFKRDNKVRSKLRRRNRFCSVLLADLATLAKTENWNDQYFTDLEADIEIEGGYFATTYHKLLRKRSFGLRRASSLIGAIESSIEQYLLLVGEPGSGKSVALRHLANQLAVKATRSNHLKAQIPLYVNLKEFVSPSFSDELTVDYVKRFVLDNIRRGDADTAEYVRENWEEFRDLGAWFFLFDSFDEIPAVLHAPSGSSVIHDHTEAISRFLVGMTPCRGVVASREYKGPEALPWNKLKILALSEERQEQLIDNSFLEPEQKSLVRHHLAANSSSLGNNPMFLTLLCRFVRDVGTLPLNDHQLLAGHIQRLANREPEYIERKYDLKPEALLEGATKLAVLFAENRILSLAPKQDEIAEIVRQQDIEMVSLENLLGALVDVKIGRSDIQEARVGDRRFTFSHRRYQETLFVSHLASFQEYLPSRELLTDARWREYAVTLLQTGEPSSIERLQREACELLRDYMQTIHRQRIAQEFGRDLYYHTWTDDRMTSLLLLMQQGLARRTALVLPELREAVRSILEPRWDHGDLYDRRRVLEIAGLLPPELLERYLSYTVTTAITSLVNTSFQQSIFLSQASPITAAWIRRQLSDLVLNATQRIELLRLEALALRLSPSIGSKIIFDRSLRLRRIIRPASLIFQIYIAVGSLGLIPFLQRRKSKSEFIQAVITPMQSKMVMIIVIGSLFAVATAAIGKRVFSSGKSWFEFSTMPYVFVATCLLAYFCALIVVCLTYLFRDAEVPLTLRYMWERMALKKNLPAFTRASRFFFPLVTSLLAFTTGTKVFHEAIELIYESGPILLGAIAGVIFVLGAITIYVTEVAPRRRLRSLLESGKSAREIVLEALSIEELTQWLKDKKNPLADDLHGLRSLSRVILANGMSLSKDITVASPLTSSRPWSIDERNRVLRVLDEQLISTS